MRKVVLYIAMSLDGYIADLEGNVSFLDDFQETSSSDYGYQDFVNTVDTCIMGRSTYSTILGFGFPWPYMDQHTYVLSSDSNFKVDSPNTTHLTTASKKVIQELKLETTGKDIWLVGGGKLVRYMLNEGLVDQMILTLVPKIIGQGIPLFPEPINPSNWIATNQSTFDSGLLVLTYEKSKP